MKYRISDLVMSKNFQGLYVGNPRPEDKDRMKKTVLEKMGNFRTDGKYEDWTGDFEPKEVQVSIGDTFMKVNTYGNTVLTTIDFNDDPLKKRNADWACVNIMFIYYPEIGETIEKKIEELLKEKTYTTYPCYY
jgi:hypothetical protein